MSTICIGCVAAASSKILECSRVMTGARQYRREREREKERDSDREGERQRESSNEAKHVWHVSAAVGGQTSFLAICHNGHGQQLHGIMVSSPTVYRTVHGAIEK